MSALANTLYNISINILIIIPVMLLFGILPNVWMAVYPLLLLPLLIIGIGMGLILSVIGVIARDIVGIVNQSLSVLFFITPVIYVKDQIDSPFLKKIISLNPLTYLIELPRSLVTLGSSPYWLEYSVISFISLIFMCACVWIFYTLHDLVAERL
jgi:lipopolysaccharide transport system permease protein